MRYKKRGEITVFLSLLISVIILFIVTLFIAAQRLITAAKVDMASEVSVQSCFAEYNRDMFSRYHILCIDPSYKQSIYDRDNIKNHFMLYLESNLYESENNSFIHYSVEEIVIEDIRYLSDDGNDVCQMINYIVTQYPYLAYESDEVKLIRYSQEVFGCWGNPSENPVRDGELEYLIYGMDDNHMNIDYALSDYEGYLNELVTEEGEYADFPYEDYLENVLFQVPEEDLMQRIKSLISEYLRKKGSPGFDWDECLTGMAVGIRVNNSHGYDYEVSREYSYDI